MMSKMMAFAMGILLWAACTKTTQQVQELRHYQLNSMDGVIIQNGVEIDRQISSDGNGSLKITALDTTDVRLFEVDSIDVENARVIYQAKIKCENLEGQAFLEMWCHFPQSGDYFSRGLQNSVSGTTNWISAETPFFLKKGEKPDMIKLNIMIAGKGIVWIDDIRVMKGPLQ